MESVTVNFAMTREDFVNGALARLKMQTSGRVPHGEPPDGRRAVRNRLRPVCPVFCGGTGRCNGSARCARCSARFSFSSTCRRRRPRCGGWLLRGLKKVCAAWRRRRCVFEGSCVEISSERYEAKIPYGMLFAAYADETTILLCTASDESRIVPKRTMSTEEQKRVESLLASEINQKFKQEGAREWTK